MSFVTPEPVASEGSDPVVTPEPATPSAPTIPEGYYPKDYVEGLRGENQKYRERFEPYANAFADFSEEDRDAFINLAQLYRNDDPDFRQQLAQQLGMSLPQEETPQYLTAAEVQKMIAEERKQLTQQRDIDEVFRVAESMGYKPDTPDNLLYLWFLNEGEDRTPEGADKAVKAFRQAIIEDFKKSKESQGKVLLQPDGAGNGSPAKPLEEPKTISDAGKRAAARFAAARAAEQ